METQNNTSIDSPSKGWYDKWHKILLIIPLVLILISFLYLFNFYNETGDFIIKDTSLSGGTTITLQGEIDSDNLESQLKLKFGDVSIRKITDLRSGTPIAIIIESSASPEELKPEVEKILGYKLTNDNSSIEFTGDSLSGDFYNQLIIALVASFVLICIVILIMFRTIVPSLAVIFAILGDIIMPLALVNYFGIKLSAAGIAAFLMLIGYSVDTDILLTSRVLKRKEGTINQRIYGAFKTGALMNVTALLAVIPAFFIVTGLPDSFRQIFLILGLGLAADIINTWLTNASILKWYAGKRRIN